MLMKTSHGKYIFNVYGPFVLHFNFFRLNEDEMNVMQNMNVDVDLSSMNRDITLEEVMNAAGKVKLGKAIGIDQLPNETFKYDLTIVLNVELFPVKKDGAVT